MNELPSDHDLLVRLDERVKYIFEWYKEHEKEHAIVAERLDKNRTLIFGALAAAATSIIGIILNFVLRG